MASAPASSSETCSMEDHLTCSICMDTFKDPVTTTCGHSFCKECLNLSCECTEKACPMCKGPLGKAPGVNIVLRDIVQQQKVEKMKEEDEDIYTDRKDDFYAEQKKKDDWARHCVRFLEEDLRFVPSEDKQEKKSLHVCQICGWSKKTTYRGLRIHQGKKGCTPKGMKIPKTEQGNPPKLWEMEVKVEMRCQSSRKLNFKEENLPKAPSRMVSVNSAAATTSNEYNSAFAASQHSSLRSTKSKPADLSTLPRVTRSVREPSTAQPLVVRPKERRVYPTLSQVSDNRAMVEDQRATVARIKEEPKSSFAAPPPPLRRATLSGPPPSPGRATRPPPPGVQPKEIRIKPQTSQIADSKTMKEKFQPTAATIKAEPTSPFAIPPWSYPGSTNPQLMYQLPDFSTGVQAISSYHQPQVNGLTWESPPTPPSATAIQPKEKDGNDKMRQETLKLELQQKFQMRKEKMSRPAERPSKNIPDPTSTSSQTNSASAVEQDHRAEGITGTSARLLTKSVPKSTNIGQENTTTTTTTTTRAAAAASTTREDPSVEGSSCISSHPVTEAKRFSATTVQQTGVQPLECQKPSQTGPNSTSTDQANTTKAATKEDPKPYGETAEPDFSTGMTVKELARMFSATTTQVTAGRPQEKHKESQTKPLALRFSATTAQQTEVQPKQKERQDQKPSQAVPESLVSNQATAEEAEATTIEVSLETTHPDVSTSLKVSELARMFSATTTQATGGRPWEKQPPSQAKLLARRFSATTAQRAAVQPKEMEAYSKKVSDSSGATANITPAAAETTTEEVPESSCETAELSDFSTGVKVKELAQMFSAATTQKTVRPKRKNV